MERMDDEFATRDSRIRLERITGLALPLSERVQDRMRRRRHKGGLATVFRVGRIRVEPRRQRKPCGKGVPCSILQVYRFEQRANVQLLRKRP